MELLLFENLTGRKFFVPASKPTKREGLLRIASKVVGTFLLEIQVNCSLQVLSDHFFTFY